MPHNPAGVSFSDRTTPGTDQGEPVLARKRNSGQLEFVSGIIDAYSWTEFSSGQVDMRGEVHKSGSSNRFVLDLESGFMRLLE